VKQAHAVQRGDKKVVPGRPVASRNEGKGSLDNEGAEFELKALVAFGVGKSEACSDICTEYIEYIE
jgi:hypothetical protein